MSISVTALVEVDFFLGGPDHQPCHPQHLVSSFVFMVFSLISFCSRFKVVFLYCNYYFFALCRNLLFFWFGNSKTFADCEFTSCVLALARSSSVVWPGEEKCLATGRLASFETDLRCSQNLSPSLRPVSLTYDRVHARQVMIYTRLLVVHENLCRMVRGPPVSYTHLTLPTSDLV